MKNDKNLEDMENDKNLEENFSGSLFLPAEMPEIHATGAAIAFNAYNFRLLFVREEIHKNDDFSVDGTIKTFNSAVGELILHPSVAKSISKSLAKEVKNYESEFGELPEL